MESNTRSLLYSDFTELLEGAVTVRAFAVKRRFLDNIHLKIDLNTRVRASSFYFSFADIVGSLVVFRSGIHSGWSTGGSF